ncbi:hypothetical protein [Methylotenera sp. 1P/1]|uniref:hypothetical protein n=1 Tax=Methylotenera sp. 1P/1 TaxID=1131551 RepID=UPI00037D5758|nr:hypothetical protein [Methylotenera sp. 1P/1]
MDTQEIPVLTEVYKTKSVKSVPDVIEVTPELRQMIANELRPLITQEVIETLTPILEARITETLSQQLLAILSAQLNTQATAITHQVSDDVTAEVTRQVAEQLQQEVILPMQATLSSSLSEQQHARVAFEHTLTEKLQHDHDEYAQALTTQSQTLLASAEDALSHKVTELGEAEILRVEAASRAQIVALQEEATAKLKTQIADSETASEDIFKYAVNAYSEQTQTRLFEEIAAQQEKFTQALEQYVQQAQSEMQTTLMAVVQTHVGTFMQEEVSQHRQSAISEINVFYQDKLAESQESASQLAQTLGQELVQTLSTYANTLTEDANQHLKVSQETLIAEASERIRIQVEQELRHSADTVRQDFNHALNADLPEIQLLLSQQVERMLDVELPVFEKALLVKAEEELVSMLARVTLTLPKQG